MKFQWPVLRDCRRAGLGSICIFLFLFIMIVKSCLMRGFGVCFAGSIGSLRSLFRILFRHFGLSATWALMLNVDILTFGNRSLIRFAVENLSFLVFDTRWIFGIHQLYILAFDINPSIKSSWTLYRSKWPILSLILKARAEWSISCVYQCSPIEVFWR